MGLCKLCGPVTRNEAEFAITYGLEDRLLLVCRWCQQDLTLLGFNANQVVHLAKPLHPKFFVPFWFLGPIRNLLEASA